MDALPEIHVKTPRFVPCFDIYHDEGKVALQSLLIPRAVRANRTAVLGV